MSHEVESVVEVEFMEGRDEHSLKARKGWLGAGRTADGDVIFGEVMHGDLATDAGESLASFTMRCYRMDEYFKVDEVREQGLMLDFGISRNMVFVEPDQVALALDSLPDPSREAVSLSGASLSDASVRRTRVSRPAETAAAVAQHREETREQLASLPALHRAAELGDSIAQLVERAPSLSARRSEPNQQGEPVGSRAKPVWGRAALLVFLGSLLLTYVGTASTVLPGAGWAIGLLVAMGGGVVFSIISLVRRERRGAAIATLVMSLGLPLAVFVGFAVFFTFFYVA